MLIVIISTVDGYLNATGNVEKDKDVDKRTKYYIIAMLLCGFFLCINATIMSFYFEQEEQNQCIQYDSKKEYIHNEAVKRLKEEAKLEKEIQKEMERIQNTR